LRWSLSNVPLGFLVIISLLVGVVIIWLVSLVLYIAAVTKNRKLLSESESKISKLEENKRQLETEIEKLQAALNEKTQKPDELEVSEIKNTNENENKEG
jgi:peptidoglycan hydrolase CwlO-like protein